MDTETGLYNINSRFYEPQIGVYVDADDIENIISNATTINGLDRNAITVDNIYNVIGNIDNIFTSGELYADVDYDPQAKWSWWDKHWRWEYKTVLY